MITNDYEIKNKKDWENILKSIFPSGIPLQKKWTELNEIKSVLSIIGSVPFSNLTFYDTNGSGDLKGCKKSSEQGCLELNMGYSLVIKPQSLTFNGVDTDDVLLNYFWLELDNLELAKLTDQRKATTTDLKGKEQMVIELLSGEYISNSNWEIREYLDEPLSDEARIIHRILRGDFVIFANTSPYQDIPSSSMGLHAKYNAEEFKANIHRLKISNK